MRVASITCVAILLLSLCVGAQDGPADVKSKKSVGHFEDTPLDEVMAAIAADAGYKVIRSREVDGEITVSLDVGAAPLETRCFMIEQCTNLRVVIHPKRKLIEVMPEHGRSALTELLFIDTRKHQAAFLAAHDRLGPRYLIDGLAPAADAEDATDALEGALVSGPLITTGMEWIGLNEEGLTARVEAGERAAIEELFNLLLAEGGGRSRWLEAQAVTWAKLSDGVLSLEAEGTLAGVLSDIARKLGVAIVLDWESREMRGDEPVSMALDTLPALDALKLLLDEYDLKMVLVGDIVYVVGEDFETFSIEQTGYAVYELDELVQQRAASAVRKSRSLVWDVYEAILDGLRVAIGAFDMEIAQFGTRIVVRGDMCRQKVATDYLTALGWKEK